MSELLVDAKEWAKKPWNAFGKKKVCNCVIIDIYTLYMLLIDCC